MEKLKSVTGGRWQFARDDFGMLKDRSGRTVPVKPCPSRISRVISVGAVIGIVVAQPCVGVRW